MPNCTFIKIHAADPVCLEIRRNASCV